MNYEEELQRLEAKFREGKQALEAKFSVLNQLPEALTEGYEPPSVHYYKLYGSVGSIHFKPAYYSSIAKGKNPDKRLLSGLLTAFAPEPVSMVKDGCKSFRPAGDYKGEVLDVCPVTIGIEVYQRHAVCFKWYARINGQLWRFEVEFQLFRVDLGTLDVRYNYYGNGDKVASVERCNFQAKHHAQVIRWASGSRDVPNNFTLWWDVTTGEHLDFPSMVKEDSNPA